MHNALAMPKQSLHDLRITWQPLSRRAGASLGQGETLAVGRFESPFGFVRAIGTEQGLRGLAFEAAIGPEAARADLARRWPLARQIEAPAVLEGWVGAAFGPHARQPVAIVASGSRFDIEVWQALLAIAPGQVSSYGALAASIGRHGAARAVGGALGRNALAFLIPCHRVLGASGGLGGYRWGPPVKRAILDWERAHGQPGA